MQKTTLFLNLFTVDSSYSKKTLEEQKKKIFNKAIHILKEELSLIKNQNNIKIISSNINRDSVLIEYDDSDQSIIPFLRNSKVIELIDYHEHLEKTLIEDLSHLSVKDRVMKELQERVEKSTVKIKFKK